MPKLVRSTREIEGRVEEVWALVDEEDLNVRPWQVSDDFAVVGKPRARADGPDRVSGRARYTVDLELSGMLHTAVLRSPYAHAKVVSLDLDAARRMPGVRAVLGPDSGLPGHQLLAPVKPPLLTDEPVFVGDAIAAVAADTQELAEAALAALDPRYEELPFEVDGEKALLDQRFVGEPAEHARGDAEAALAGSDVTVEIEVETPAHHQTPLEPHAALAEWRGDELTLWVSTQGTFWARNELADAFDLPKEKIRVVSEFVGGGFGGKPAAGNEGILAAALARAAKRPVRCVLDRHEEQQIGGQRAPTRQTVRLGASRDGKLRAIEAEAVVEVGARGMVFGIPAPYMSLYACENVGVSVFPVRLNLRGQTAYRAPGVMEGVTALEQAMDELAGKLGIDPIELRRRNHADVDPASGDPFSDKQLLACYDRLAELSNWAQRDALRQGNGDGLLRGMGMASAIWFGGGGPPAHATMRIGGDGYVTVITGIQDVGTGARTAAQMVAAEALGIDADRVRVMIGDTLPEVFAPIAGGSMTVPSVMPAVRSAGTQLKKRLLELAADIFEVSPDDLELREGRIRSTDRALDRPYTEVTEKLGDATIDSSGSRGPNAEGVKVFTFGAQAAQVAVDPGLGTVRVEKIWAVHDSGLIVNPLTASSQVEGGVLQAIGHALSEERFVDPTTGAPTNAYLDDYKLPTIADAPEIVVDFVGNGDGTATSTATKGLGEPPIVPTAAAIANAFAHATGRRSPALPLTPYTVLEALR